MFVLLQDRYFGSRLHPDGPRGRKERNHKILWKLGLQLFVCTSMVIPPQAAQVHKWEGVKWYSNLLHEVYSCFQVLWSFPLLQKSPCNRPPSRRQGHTLLVEVVVVWIHFSYLTKAVVNTMTPLTRVKSILRSPLSNGKCVPWPHFLVASPVKRASNLKHHLSNFMMLPFRSCLPSWVVSRLG